MELAIVSGSTAKTAGVRTFQTVWAYFKRVTLEDWQRGEKLLNIIVTVITHSQSVMFSDE